MNKYEIMINKKPPHISYTINALNYDKLKLINEIKNDENIDELVKYYDSKYDKLKNEIIPFIHLLINDKNNIVKIACCMVLVLLLIYHNEYIKRVTYDKLKIDLCN